MTLLNGIALFTAMALLAAAPSTSVLAVTARSVSAGFKHGVFTALGIVTGDIVYILVAIFGLAAVADSPQWLFTLIKLLGGSYLIWLGVSSWRDDAPVSPHKDDPASAVHSSYLTGLAITLGDQKAILFYLGFLPAFIELDKITYLDTGIIIAIAVIAVGGVKISYAYLASRGRDFVSASTYRAMRKIAAGLIIFVGLLVLLDAMSLLPQLENS